MEGSNIEEFSPVSTANSVVEEDCRDGAGAGIAWYCVEHAQAGVNFLYTSDGLVDFRQLEGDFFAHRRE